MLYPARRIVDIFKLHSNIYSHVIHLFRSDLRICIQFTSKRAEEEWQSGSMLLLLTTGRPGQREKSSYIELKEYLYRQNQNYLMP